MTDPLGSHVIQIGVKQVRSGQVRRYYRWQCSCGEHGAVFRVSRERAWEDWERSPHRAVLAERCTRR